MQSLLGTGLVIWKVEVIVAVLPAVDPAEAECCVAALATELAFCVAELATARAAAVGILAPTWTRTWGISWPDKWRSGLCPLLQSSLPHLLPLYRMSVSNPNIVDTAR